ncbi:MAG: NnrU family protein [Burkholderiaceae bacterium]
MFLLVGGLALFRGLHSVRIFAEDRRTRLIAAHGLGWWKGAYSAVAIAGFAMIAVGFGQARRHAVLLWSPSRWTHDLAGVLMLAAFVLLAAAYVPGNGIKARVRDPLILGTKLWATAHLLANGSAADVVLFGSFLAWSVLDFRAARRRRAADDDAAAAAAPANRWGTAVAVAGGVAAWAAFVFWLHGMLFGVRPFG